MLPQRVETYLVARQHLRLRADAGKPKTSGKIKCEPPNKKCGKRCIPPNWNCRITGGGLDSHSRVVEFDPVKGTSSIIRGTKNVIEGYKKGDPEKISRGIGGIERGIVKVTPGNSAEEKQRFRKRLKAVSTAAFFGVVGTLAAVKSHQTLKRGFPEYRNGLGAQIDAAAQRAADRVVDSWDAGVDRVGLGGILGTGRAATEAGGRAAARRIAYQNIVQTAAENRTLRTPKDTNYLATRSRLRVPAPGIAQVNQLDVQARNEGWTAARWEREKAKALYSMEVNGRSVFAAPAAHELLARQWGFQLPERAARLSDEMVGLNNEVSRVRNHLLPQAIREMHESLSADFERQRFPRTAAGIRDYATRMIEQNPGLITGRTAPERARAERAFRTRITDLLAATSSVQQRSLSNNTYNQVVEFYDGYFKRAVADMDLHAARNESPLGDAAFGLARLHASQRTVSRVGNNFRTGGRRYPIHPADRNTAGFINNYYFHDRVKREKGPYMVGKADTVLNYARYITGQTFTDTQAALDALNARGFRVAIGRPRRPATPPPTNPFLPSPPRTDAPERGKPCGASYISKNYKCGKGAGAAPAVAANKHDKAYRARQIASLVARSGAIVGSMTYVGYVGRYYLNNPDQITPDKLQTMFAVASAGGLAAMSIAREKRVTRDSEQLAEDYEPLKKLSSSDAKTIDKVQTFVRAADIDAQRVPTIHMLKGVGGYFDSAKPDRIHVTDSGHSISRASNHRNPAQAYANGMDQYMRYRARLKKGLTQEDAVTVEQTLTNFSASSWVKNSEAKRLYLNSHEMAHAIHYRSMFASPKYVEVNGVRYEGEALERELLRSTSYYGQTDLRRKSVGPTDNYYDQGNRLETYAENFALYMGNAKTMREVFPVSYEWTRQTTNYALSKPTKVKARPFLEVIRSINDGTERFIPEARRDSAPESEILANLKRMQTAATAGDIGTALELMAIAQSYPLEVRFMFGSLMETTFLYSHIASMTSPS